MADSDQRKAKTSWPLLVWPILILWVIIWMVVPHTEFREQAHVVAPILMVAVAFLVILAHAVAGSITQRRIDLTAIDESTTSCMGCGRDDCELRVIDYQGYVFPLFTTLVYPLVGKFCEACARREIDRLLRRTLWGCILCPPYIVWAWLHRQREMAKFKGSADLPGAQA